MPRHLLDRPKATAGAEETRARRAFITDMLERNPQAFTCAEDVQHMIGHFPHRF
ncbi:hypothetical protein [Maliponia aquimaris]|uniref:hypothetical protein n=1 Tax=Maliponia aquimaris TaxID=1673631 RepID=UPI00159526F5|nr:hypothetical protein [Maliponia aquimaris]